MAAKTLGGYPEFARETIGATGALNDFQGRRIGQARILSKWETPKSYVSSEMFQIEVTTPEGFVYTGRGAGSGMLWKGKLKATQPRSSRANGRTSRPNGATFAKVTGDRARGSTVRGARHNYRTVGVLVYQSPNSMATARTYEIVTDASYNMGDGAYTTDVWKLPEPVAVQQAIYTAVRNLRGGGRNRRAPVQAE